MFKEIENAVSEYNMFGGKKRVIAALSGGADSMCLLHFLVTNARSFGITVCAAHLNHCLRGEESERDFEFVVAECRKLGVELFTKRSDIAGLAKTRKIGLEECGREERYRFFEELIHDDETVVATAHTASDNAETVLMNITRGCGIEGLTGIPPVRGNIVRPLIRCSRKHIEEYCEMNGVSFVTDSSNFSEEYNRNKIRLSVLPNLKRINPSVESSINRLSVIASKNLEYIRKKTNEEYESCKCSEGLSISKLKNCDSNILAEVIKLAIDKYFNISAEKKHIDIIGRIINDGHGAIELRKNKTVRAVGDSLVFESAVGGMIEVPRFEDTAFKLGMRIEYNNKAYIFSPKKNISELNNVKINKKLLNQCISCDIISCDTVIRNRKSGDIFKPVGRNCTKTVKKLFNEMKLPQDERDTLLVLANGSNVLWIEGIGASQDALPKSEDTDCFTVEIIDIM